ncbi:MAG: DUF1080 domain-containing protein [Chloroherpetonaceae bacterium]|nr:DUF1080 domain-containing protein [Chthonomonadaceae bacterium]MDW8208193.1 DUF1080 domain-containing protein [Chloroherpetonaceae bacterium]
MTQWVRVWACVCLALVLSDGAIAQGRGFVRLFDGQTLNGWTIVGKKGVGYVVRDGAIVCPADGGGNLMSEKTYSDFILRFEFKLARAGNNGVAIRTPLHGHPASEGMEIQILDDRDEMYRDIKPWQAHGSIYGVVPARRDALKPVGEWNQEEISVIGRRVRVRVNGKTVVDVDLNTITDPAILAAHPGLLRDSGHIGFAGHGPSEVQFRNIAIRDLSKPEKDNTPPPGFVALFNGRDLTGWKGLVADPPTRARMTPEQLAEAQKKADAAAFQHWKVVNGEIVYDGKQNNLCTVRDYGDFELLVDWKIHAGGDSGIYLRGSPQVQIWDRPEGSGGLYNNQKNPSNPIKKADRPVGEWNRFRILMIGDRVTVFLNGELVVHNVVMENYWERDRPIYPTGPIELQHHGDALWFKNIYIREIPRK